MSQQLIIELETPMVPHCPYCGSTDLIITEDEYHGHTFFHLHHSDYDHNTRRCGFLAYHWDKNELIKTYNQE